MADNIKDLAAQLNNLVASLNDAGEKIIGSFEKSAGKALNLDAALKQVLETSDDIPKNIKSASELMNKMKTDSNLNKKIMDRIARTQKSKINSALSDALKKIDRQSKSYKNQAMQTQFQKKAVEAIEVAHSKVLAQIENQNERLKAQSGSVKDLLSQLDKAEGVTGKMSVLMNQMKSGRGMKALAGAAGLKILQRSFDGIKKALSGLKSKFEETFGIQIGGPFETAINIIFRSLTELWRRENEDILPTTAKMNKMFGNTRELTKQLGQQAIQTGDRFEVMGLDFHQGTQAVLDFASSIRQVEMTDQLRTLGVKLTQFVGMSSDAAADLFFAFDRSGRSVKDMNEFMTEAELTAREYNVPVNQLRKSMSENIDLMQRFGIQNRMQFAEASALALSYGTSVEKVNNAFGKSLDTFDASAEVSAKLNTAFGTSINSMKLMNETNPARRMAMLGSAISDQLGAWEDLSVHQKNVVTNTLNIDEKTAALVMSQKNLAKGTDFVTKEMQKQQKQQEKLQKAQENWDKAIGSLQEKLVNVQKQIKDLFRTIGNAFIAFMNGLTGADVGVDDFADGIKAGFKAMREAIGPPKRWREIGTSIREFVASLPEMVSKLTNAFDKIEQSNVGWLLGLSDSGGAEEKNKRRLERQMQRAASGLGSPLGAHRKFAAGRDALVTKKGDFIKFDPNDNILATKSPIQQGPKGATATAGSMGGSGMSNVQIVAADVHLDGKKVGSAQFKAIIE